MKRREWKEQVNLRQRHMNQRNVYVPSQIGTQILLQLVIHARNRITIFVYVNVSLLAGLCFRSSSFSDRCWKDQGTNKMSNLQETIKFPQSTHNLSTESPASHSIEE